MFLGVICFHVVGTVRMSATGMRSAFAASALGMARRKYHPNGSVPHASDAEYARPVLASTRGTTLNSNTSSSGHSKRRQK